MICRNIILIILIFVIWIPCAWSADTVKSYIIADFNPSNPQMVNPTSIVKSTGLIKLWLYMSIQSDSPTITPETYFLEFVFNSGDEDKIHESYRSNKEHYVYKRKIDRSDDFYFIPKRILAENKEVYKFRVYVETKNGMKLVSETQIFIKEADK